MAKSKKREEREKNCKLVYEALRDIEKKNPLPSGVHIGTIENNVRDYFGLRTVYRCLGELKDTHKVANVSDGYYISKIQLETMKESKEKLKEIYKITSLNMRGYLEPSYFGDMLEEYINVLDYSKVVRKVKEDIYNNRVKIHKDKQLSGEESEIFIKSFMDGINIKILSSNEKIHFKPSGFFTFIKQNPFIKHINKKTGLDSNLYEYAFLLYYILYQKGNLDFTDVGFLGENKIKIELEFDFNIFIFSFLSWISRLRVYRGLEVYSEIPESDLRKVINDYDREDVRKEFERIFNQFSNSS